MREETFITYSNMARNDFKHSKLPLLTRFHSTQSDCARLKGQCFRRGQGFYTSTVQGVAMLEIREELMFFREILSRGISQAPGVKARGQAGQLVG